jgi:SAM-dependent methyltransferase
MCAAAATHEDFADHPKSAAVVAGDAVSLPLAEASVDGAIAFMCLHDMDNMPGAIAEVARVLEDGRQLALAIVHPMYSNGNFARAEDGAGSFVITRSYFERQLCVSTDRQDDLTVTFLREHRPLETYVQALLKAGFTIDRLLEVTDEAEGKPVPMFLDILATRKPRQQRASLAARVRGRTAMAGAMAGAGFALGLLTALLALLR